MNYDYYEWYSPNVGLQMGVLRIGHWGPALIYLPTCGGDHTEFERYGMEWDAKWWIDNGKVQFFSVDAINHLTYYNRHLHPADRVKWAMGYERYVVDEVLPLVRHVTNNPFVGIFGASFGGYNVTNLYFKHPDQFDLAVSMSGVFDIRPHLDGYYDDNCYFNNPVDYLPNLSDPWYYRHYNEKSLYWMLCGENDICISDNDSFHAMLEWKGIRHWYDRWPAPCDHHEYWWKKMLPVVLSKFYNW